MRVRVSIAIMKMSKLILGYDLGSPGQIIFQINKIQ